MPRSLLRTLVCLIPGAVSAATPQRGLATALFLIPRSLLRRRFHRRCGEPGGDLPQWTPCPVVVSAPRFGPQRKKPRRHRLGQAGLLPMPAPAAVSPARPASARPAPVSLLHAADQPAGGAKDPCVSGALPPAGGDRGDVFAFGKCSSGTQNAVLRLRQDALLLRLSCSWGESAAGGAVGSRPTSPTAATLVPSQIAGRPER